MKFESTFALIVSACLYASMSLISRLLGQNFSEVMQVLARTYLAAIIALVVYKERREWLKVSYINFGKLLLLGFLTALTIVSFTYAINSINVASAVFFLYASSFTCSVVVDKYIFREKLQRQRLIALTVAILGLCLYINFSVATVNLGVLAAIVTGVFETIGNVIRKQLTGAKTGSLVFYPYLTTAIVCLILLPFIPGPAIKELSLVGTGLCIVFAFALVGQTRLAQIGLAHISIGTATIILSSELFFGVLISAFVLHEQVAVNEVFGSIILLLAIVVANFKQGSKA